MTLPGGAISRSERIRNYLKHNPNSSREKILSTLSPVGVTKKDISDYFSRLRSAGLPAPAPLNGQQITKPRAKLSDTLIESAEAELQFDVNVQALLQTRKLVTAFGFDSVEKAIKTLRQLD